MRHFFRIPNSTRSLGKTPIFCVKKTFFLLKRHFWCKKRHFWCEKRHFSCKKPHFWCKNSIFCVKNPIFCVKNPIFCVKKWDFWENFFFRHNFWQFSIGLWFLWRLTSLHYHSHTRHCTHDLSSPIRCCGSAVVAAAAGKTSGISGIRGVVAARDTTDAICASALIVTLSPLHEYSVSPPASAPPIAVRTSRCSY